MNELRIKNVIFCEDVRPEMNGKYTLLGASSSELSITLDPVLKIPVVISIALFIVGEPTKEGPFSMDIRVMSPEKKRIIGGNLKGDFKSNLATSIVLGPMPMQVEKSGTYFFEWNFGNEEWEEIAKLNVTLNKPETVTNPAPSGLLPPS